MVKTTLSTKDTKNFLFIKDLLCGLCALVAALRLCVSTYGFPPIS